MVEGGLLDIAYVTHVTFSISLVILELIFSSVEYGSLAQSAVIASIDSTTHYPIESHERQKDVEFENTSDERQLQE